MWLLAGCVTPEPPPEGVEVRVVLALPTPDRDGDGFVDDDDCRPDDPAVHPGAVERCDGADQDCDGAVDESAEDAVDLWPDDDGDGFGAGAAERFCPGTPSFADNRADCDDFDAARSPIAPEVCDGIDNDCDLLVDDADTDTVDLLPFFTDADGDGFGAPEAHLRCAAGSDETPVVGDCDDEDDSVHPASFERCNDRDDDCDTLIDDEDPGVLDQRSGFVDLDGDGFGAGSAILSCALAEEVVAVDGDCDDEDATVSPLGVEVCGGADEDCDGLVDDADAVAGAPTSFEDADADGWGGDRSVTACVVPEGWVAITGDCDEANGTVHPGAEERCAEGDEDCDGLEGIGDPSVVDLRVVYDDDDGDGFAGGAGYQACEGETTSTDCDDGDAAYFPGAPEACAGGDRDCDGLTADADPDVVPTRVWYVDLDWDGYGTDAVLACAGDASVAGDCLDSDASVAPDVDETCNNGVDDDCDASTRCGLPDTATSADADLTLFRTGGSGFAESILVHDVDGDGVLELITSEPLADEGASDSGGVWVVSAPLLPGDVRGATRATIHGAEDDRIGGLLVAVEGGFALSAGDDLHVFSAPSGSRDLGDAWRVFAACDTIVSFAGGHVCASSATATLTAYDTDGVVSGVLTGSEDGAGADLAVADLDGDGVDELVVGAPDDDAAGENAGAIYAVPWGDADGTLAELGTAWTGITGDHAGWMTRALGDVDGDGRDDLLVGAPGADSVLLVGTLAPGAVRDAAFGSATGEGSTGFGRGGVAAADFNGDGAVDLALGGPMDEADQGAVFGWYGPITGDYGVEADLIIKAEQADDGLGGRYGVAAGDLDGDGLADLVLGSPAEEAGADADAGAVFLFSGGGL